MEMKNRVKKGRLTEFSIYSERAGEVISGQKYTWICTGCGREWLMRQDARRCQHIDYVWYGITRIYCLRKLEVVNSR